MTLRLVKTTELFISDHAQNMMIALWYRGWDTFAIAKALSFPEHEVANRLPTLRSRHKQMRGGGNGVQRP